MKNRINCIVIIFTMTALALSCSKNNDNPVPEQTCRITSITSSSSGVPASYFSYNDDGRVREIRQGDNVVKNFVYSGPNTIIMTYISGIFDMKIILTWDDNGFVLNRREEFNETGTDWYNISFEYNDMQLSRSVSTNSRGITRGITTYSWENGNLASKITPNTTLQYEYYTDKPMQLGDYSGTHDDLRNYGAENAIHKNKNLVKSIFITNRSTGSSSTQNWSYEFDSLGKIVAAVSLLGSTSTRWDYEYECE
ncbi:MAG: hypothetical protein ACK5JD_01480 [Mangrovibacterium sp.]